MEGDDLGVHGPGKVDSASRQPPGVETLPCLLQTASPLPPSELESTQTPLKGRSWRLVFPLLLPRSGALRHGLVLRPRGRSPSL